MPVVLPFNHAKADNGVIHLAQRLIKPLKFDGLRESGDVD
jgi:hypothetical protein